MSRRPRFATVTAEQYRRLPTEADMLTGLEEVTDLKGGFFWHIKDSRQCPEMADFWDTTILLPGAVFLLELKSQARSFQSAEQEEVAAFLSTVRQAVCGVVRPVPRPGELSYDEVLEMLRRA